ncbi:hypothetical protein EVG20_g11628, partial [Dentipellis fragilis]
VQEPPIAQQNKDDTSNACIADHDSIEAAVMAPEFEGELTVSDDEPSTTDLAQSDGEEAQSSKTKCSQVSNDPDTMPQITAQKGKASTVMSTSSERKGTNRVTTRPSHNRKFKLLPNPADQTNDEDDQLKSSDADQPLSNKVLGKRRLKIDDLPRKQTIIQHPH